MDIVYETHLNIGTDYMSMFKTVATYSANMVTGKMRYIKVTVPDDKVYNIGKYGRMHAKFIKENRPCFYSMKMMDGTWLAYLE